MTSSSQRCWRISTSCEAVSYTHLDVYKRQALKDPENIRRVVMGEQIGTTVKEEF